MALTLAPKNLKRYKDIAWLLVKYGRGDLARGFGIEGELAGEERPEPSPLAENLAKDLERLGPTYIKLGQVLSTRADFLPAPYVEALSRLQDRVEPFSFGDVEKIVAEELGVRRASGSEGIRGEAAGTRQPCPGPRRKKRAQAPRRRDR